MNANSDTKPINTTELEGLVRRVVREELSRLLREPLGSLLEGAEHEGPKNPAEDEMLLKDALAVIEEYGYQPEAWMNWEEFEAELDRAEAAGELPR